VHADGHDMKRASPPTFRLTTIRKHLLLECEIVRCFHGHQLLLDLGTPAAHALHLRKLRGPSAHTGQTRAF
jgi:hypothetical protein